MNRNITHFPVRLLNSLHTRFPLAIVQETPDSDPVHLSAILPRHHFQPSQSVIDRILAYSRTAQ